MRVIAGSARSLRLKTLEGTGVRPTTDRIKETLFNMINDKLYGCRFLDIFAGSGGIGIEALSRGADSCYFIDDSPKAIKCIEENLRFTNLTDHAVLMKADAVTAIKRLADRKLKFDIVFIDPPYEAGFEQNVLQALAESGLVGIDSLIIIEAGIRTDFGFLSEMNMTVFKEKHYKTNKHVFICLNEERQ